MTDSTPHPEGSPFVLNCSDLLTRASGVKHVSVTAPCSDLHTSTVAVPDSVTFDADIERIPEGIVVRGTVRGTWSAECSSGLEPITEPFSYEFAELFEREPLEGQTYPIEGTQIDLTQVVRDTVLPELPLAPRCADAVDGFCDRCADMRPAPQEASIDPRWAALSEISVAPQAAQSDQEIEEDQ